MELDLQKRKFEAEEHIKKKRFILEMEERKSLIELLKHK